MAYSCVCSCTPGPHPAPAPVNRVTLRTLFVLSLCLSFLVCKLRMLDSYTNTDITS